MMSQLKSQLHSLYQDNLNLRNLIRINQMTIDVKKIKNHAGEGIIGKYWTFLAQKNLNSYMIVTSKKGIKVFENSNQIYSDKCFEKDSRLRDAIYIKHLNCYLMSLDKTLYRKDIDEKPPYVFMNIVCGYRFGACFLYSDVHERLIIHKGHISLSVVNLDR